MAKKVLIVEDEKPLARALELKLTHAGFDTRAASDGEAGLAALEKEKFDLILCDLVMPKVDGFAFLKTIKEKNIRTPVIVLTNLSQPDDEKRVRDLGAADFFIKSNMPVTELVERISKQLQA